MSEHVDVSKIKDLPLRRLEKKLSFNAMNPCPIDFSEFQSSNPRSQGEQKEYEGKDASNFNRRQNILIVKSLNSQHLLAVDRVSTCRKGPLPALYGLALPLAHRIAIAIDLLGLDKVISKGTVDPHAVQQALLQTGFFTLDKDEKDLYWAFTP